MDKIIRSINRAGDWYQVGNGLPGNHYSYVKRESDEILFQKLTQKEYCYILTARQSGKTSLLNQMKYKLEHQSKVSNNSCAVIDLTAIGTQRIDEETWYSSIIDILSDGLEADLSEQIDLNEWFKEHNYLSTIGLLGKFLQTILYSNLESNFYIFVDEIDSVLSLDFSADDFFAFIRSCHNKRSYDSHYHRLTFVIFGVANASDLIRDSSRTPFNTARSVELLPLKIKQNDLTQFKTGLDRSEKVNDSSKVLERIFYWTNGQPFLTQKLCQMVCENPEKISQGQEEIFIDDLVKNKIVVNWDNEFQDSPKHLRTIKDRLMHNPKRTIKLLRIYLSILNEEKLSENYKNIIEYDELKLSGLILEENGIVQVYNKIYAQIFDKEWVKQRINKLRLNQEESHYQEQLTAWIASDYTDKSRLLQGKALEEAEKYAHFIQLEDDESKFLRESQKYQFNNRIKRIAAIASIIILGLLTAVSFQELTKRRQILQSIVNDSANASITQFQSQELDSLTSAMLAGKGLKDISSRTNNLEKYKTTTPLFALQSILNQIREQTQLNVNQDPITNINFHPWRNEILVFGTDDGSIWKWDIQNKKKELVSLEDESMTHKEEITVLDFSPNGDYLVSADKSGKALFWDTTDLTKPLIAKSFPMGNIANNSGSIRSVAISSDDQVIAIGTDQRIELWNKRRQFLRELEDEDGEIDAIAFSPDLKTKGSLVKGTMVTAHGKGMIKVWNYVKSGKSINIDQINTYPTDQDIINDLKISPDGQFIVSAGKDGTTKIWKLDQEKQSFELIKNLKAHQDSVLSLSFDKDGKLLATASQDGTVILWDMSKLEDSPFLTQLKGHKGSVTNVSFSPDERLLTTASQDGIIRLWDLSKLKLLDLEQFDKVTFSPDRKTIAAFNKEGKVTIWKNPINENNSSIPLELSKNIVLPSNNRCNEKISSFAFQGNNKIILGTEQGNICIFDTFGNFQDDQIWNAHESSSINSIAVDPDQPKFFVTASDKGELKKWSLDGQIHSLEKTIFYPDECYDEIFFDPRGNFLLTTNKDRKLSIYDQNLEVENVFRDYIDFSISDSKRYLVVIKIDSIEIFQSSDISRPIKTLQLKKLGLGKVSKVRFSHDDKYLAIVEKSGQISIWEIADFLRDQADNPTLKKRWKGHINEVSNIAFSPDGKILATAEQPEEGNNTNIKNFGKVKLWNWKGNKSTQNKGQTDPYLDAKKLQIAEFQGSNFYFSAAEVYEEQSQIIIERNKGLIIEPIKTLDELLKEGCQWLQLNELDKDLEQFCQQFANESQEN